MTTLEHACHQYLRENPGLSPVTVAKIKKEVGYITSDDGMDDEVFAHIRRIATETLEDGEEADLLFTAVMYLLQRQFGELATAVMKEVRDIVDDELPEQVVFSLLRIICGATEVGYGFDPDSCSCGACGLDE